MIKTVKKYKKNTWNNLGALVDYIAVNRLIQEIGVDGLSILLHIHRQCMIEPSGYALFTSEELLSFLNLGKQYDGSRFKRARAKLIKIGLLEHIPGNRFGAKYKVIFTM
jgi:hypothetical protein